MGIRFRCHGCDHTIHVKDYLAGKRGKCPDCGMSLRIPDDGNATSYAVQTTGEARSSSRLTDTAETKSNRTENSLSQNDRSPRTKPATVQPSPHANSPSQHSAAMHSAPSSSGVRAEPINQSSSNAPVSPPRKSAPSATAFPAGNYFVQPPSGGTYGPVEADVLVDWIEQNRLTRDSLIRNAEQPASAWLRIDSIAPAIFAGQSLSQTGANPKSVPPPQTQPATRPKNGNQKKTSEKQSRGERGTADQFPSIGLSDEVVKSGLGLNDPQSSNIATHPGSELPNIRRKQARRVWITLGLLILAGFLTIALLLVLVYGFVVN